MAPPRKARYWTPSSHRERPARSTRYRPADGVAEVVEMSFPRQVRLGGTQPPRYSLRVRIDGGATHTLAGNGADSPPAEQPVDAVVGGPAEALLLLLWRRTTLDDPRLQHSGSRDAAAAVLDAGITP